MLSFGFGEWSLPRMVFKGAEVDDRSSGVQIGAVVLSVLPR